MCIEYIKIENFGAIRSYRGDFSPELNIIDSRYSAEIAAAVHFVLCSRGSSSIPERWLREDTRISAGVRLGDQRYQVRATPVLGRLQLFAADSAGQAATKKYQYMLFHCAEQDEIEAFDGHEKTASLRLYRYCDREINDNLSGKTQRLSDTKTFHSHLARYIRNYEPERINCQKDYQTVINSSGQFSVRHPEFKGKIYLSQTEQKLFNYICFLNVAEFWADFAQLRDLHHAKKPLLVQNFIEYLDESADISGLLARTKKLQRQVILLTIPLDEESKKKWEMEKYGIFFRFDSGGIDI